MESVNSMRILFVSSYCFFRGLFPSYILSLNPAIQYLVFDQLKFWWLKNKSSESSISSEDDDSVEKIKISITLGAIENFLLGAMCVGNHFTFLI